jgi:hypothetical protein
VTRVESDVEPGRCPDCHAAVLWAQSAKHEDLAVDAAPVADGNLVLEKRWDGKAREFFTAAVTFEPLLHAQMERYRSHVATCPAAKPWRKREAAGVRSACPVGGCGTPIPGRMLLCKRHWGKVPRALQRKVWELYVAGQEADRSLIRPGYLEAMTAAVAAAEEAEDA